jgi:hypothetical protein
MISRALAAVLRASFGIAKKASADASPVELSSPSMQAVARSAG